MRFHLTSELNPMRYLYIAEKPSVMKAVAAVYEKNKAQVDAAVGGQIEFVALAGHVCRYLQPNEYDEYAGTWASVPLPIIPQKYRIGQIPDKVKLIKNISSALKNCDGIIVGTDSDVEGCGIYYLLAEHLKLGKLKTLRYFESSMTDEEILTSLLSMTDFWTNPRDTNMTKAYLARSRFDWLVGMNATRSCTLSVGEKLTIGRVKAPTLKLVYDNSMAIDNFAAHSDYQAKVYYKEGFSGIYVDDDGNPVDFDTPEKAQNFLRELTNSKASPNLQSVSGNNTASASASASAAAGTESDASLAGSSAAVSFPGDGLAANVTKLEKKTVKTAPPQLYTLSKVAIDSGSKYNYTPAKSDSIVQALYEKGYVSYPRTDTPYVSKKKADEFQSLLSTCLNVPSLNPYIKQISYGDIKKAQSNKKIVNDAEVAKGSHDALLVTSKKPQWDKLSPDEQNIYELIAKRFVAQFMGDKVEEKKTLLAVIGGSIFKSTGSVTKEKGWSELYDQKEKAEVIPDSIKKGSVLNPDHFDVHEKKSSPPARLTMATLIAAMEHIDKNIEEKELKNIMKQAHGIGTQSSRSSITEELVKNGYMVEKGKNHALYITEGGKHYIESLKGFSITDPSSAAQWESMFADVRSGDMDYKEAQARTIKYVTEFVKEAEKLKPLGTGSSSNRRSGSWRSRQTDVSKAFKTAGSVEGRAFGTDVSEHARPSTPGTPFEGCVCPWCGSGLLRDAKGLHCEKGRQECGFSLCDPNGKVTAQDILDLTEKKKTRVIPGVGISRAGRPFDAAFVLNEKGSRFAAGFSFT